MELYELNKSNQITAQPKPEAANIDVGKYVKDYRKKIDDSIDQVREFASKK